MTDHEADPLVDVTPAQHLAIETLLTGGTQQQAADAAGVARETVNRWTNHHPGFIAALNQGRRARTEELRDRAREIDAAAVEAVLQAVRDGDTRAALDWMRMRPIGPAAVDPSAPMTPDEVIDERVNARFAQVAEDLFQRMEASLQGRLGHVVPDRDAIRETVRHELGREAGLPPQPEPDPEPHWSEAPCVTASFVLIADSDEDAHRAWDAQDATSLSDASDLSPITDFDLVLLAEDIQPERQLHAFREVPADDAVTLVQLDPAFTAALTSIPEGRIFKIAVDWSENPDLSTFITAPECATVISNLRDIVAAVPKDKSVYLAATVRCDEEGGRAVPDAEAA